MTIVLGRGLAAFRVGGPKGVRRLDRLGEVPGCTSLTGRRRNRKKLRVPGNRCEICLRHRDEPPAPEQLEVHHVLGISAMIGAGVLALSARLARSAPAPAPPSP
jgi:hypothetical protein